jgi:hypothetical protein
MVVCFVLLKRARTRLYTADPTLAWDRSVNCFNCPSADAGGTFTGAENTGVLGTEPTQGKVGHKGPVRTN